MKRILKLIAVVIFAAVVWSMVPVAELYLKKAPAPYTNEQAAEKLKDKRGEYFGFIIFSDNHAGLVFDDSATLKLIRSMNREDRFKKLPIDFVASAGDVTFRGSEWDYSVYNKVRSLIKWPVISGMGNHDDDKKSKKGGELFKRYIGKKEFAFADRNSYFIILDDTVGRLSEGQFSRLEDELKKSLSYKHRFVIIHKPPLSYQQSWYRPELSPWPRRFMKLCEAYKVDIVFSGHEHMFKETVFGGVKYIISGGGGVITQIPSSDGGFLHYLVVRVNGDYVDYEVRKVLPPLWEGFFYYIWKEFFYFLKRCAY